MDSDRKYRQHGYNDSSHSNGHGSNGHHHNGNGEGRPKPSGPRPPIDVTGPRLPRLVQAVTASRCFSCATTLPPGTDFTGIVPQVQCSVTLLQTVREFRVFHSLPSA